MPKRQVYIAFFIVMLLITTIIVASCRSHSEYTGETLNDLPHGYGTLTHPGGAVYEGQFKEGLRSGFGIWRHPEGIYYEGSWQNDLYHSNGVLYIPGVYTYEGQWSAGQKNGRGFQTWVNGRRYEGQWRNGLMHGSGTLHYADGSYYGGQWQEGRQHGPGTLYQADGEILSGTWNNGAFVHIPVEIIILTAQALALNLNDQPYQVMAIAVPLEATKPHINWISSNPEVATVEAGLITALSTGETIITAHAEYDNVESECFITVLPPPVLVTGIELTQTMISLTTGGEPVALQYSIEPVNADNREVRWSSSNPAIATVSEAGLVTPIAAGQTEITARTADGDYSDTTIVNVR
ncbi:MAG: Ig-like domain-containing protein [Bacillota bacterium]|nr:Ig-like domain-containing protein [Bacillota bacterium]